jgi:hypothetical protein
MWSSDTTGEAILKSRTEEPRQQFGGVIRAIVESRLAQALATSQKQMGGWINGALGAACLPRSGQKGTCS